MPGWAVEVLSAAPGWIIAAAAVIGLRRHSDHDDRRFGEHRERIERLENGGS